VDLSAFPELTAAVAAVEEKLGERGRVLLRPSGTEPLVRVMVEGEERAEVESLCAGLATEVKAILC
jgi:phosphoglucosamine mutase